MENTNKYNQIKKKTFFHLESVQLTTVHFTNVQITKRLLTNEHCTTLQLQKIQIRALNDIVAILKRLRLSKLQCYIF